MKRRNIFLLAILLLGWYAANSQNVANEIANKIAQRMKDSLHLNESVKNRIYAINMQLHNQKMAARQQHARQDSLGIYIQRIENTRDSLYHKVLSENQYLIYRQKKRKLVNNN